MPQSQPPPARAIQKKNCAIKMPWRCPTFGRFGTDESKFCSACGRAVVPCCVAAAGDELSNKQIQAQVSKGYGAVAPKSGRDQPNPQSLPSSGVGPPAQSASEDIKPDDSGRDHPALTSSSVAAPVHQPADIVPPSGMQQDTGNEPEQSNPPSSTSSGVATLTQQTPIVKEEASVEYRPIRSRLGQLHMAALLLRLVVPSKMLALGYCRPTLAMRSPRKYQAMPVRHPPRGPCHALQAHEPR